MKKIILTSLIALMCSALVAQKKQSKSIADPTKGYNKTETGLYYKIHKDDKSKPAIKETNIVRFHFQVRTEKDSLLRTTFTSKEPLIMAVPKPPFKGSLEEGFTVLSEGDSASVLIRIDSLFQKLYKQPIPPFLNNQKYLKFNVKIIKSMTEEEHVKEMREKTAIQDKEDDRLIQEYIKQNNIANAVKTPSGLYFVSTQTGSGTQAEKGKKVSVHYTGKLLNGSVFDSSVGRGAPFEFNLGAGMVIAGWDEGIALMKVGEKGLLLIPSGMGYGPQGAGAGIPPNSVLIFEVELMDVK